MMSGKELMRDDEGQGLVQDDECLKSSSRRGVAKR